MVILHELDSKKYTSRSRQQSDRARSVLRSIQPLIEQGIAGDGAAEFGPGMALEVLDEDDRHQQLPDKDSRSSTERRSSSRSLSRR